jgi:hypothetical protein
VCAMIPVKIEKLSAVPMNTVRRQMRSAKPTPHESTGDSTHPGRQQDPDFSRRLGPPPN